MKVNYYFRNQGPGNFSIESVFATVLKGIQARAEVEQFNTRSPFDLRSAWRFRKLNADVHHITGAVNYLALGLPASRLVITVHDIGHFTETLKGFKRCIYKYLFWTLPLRRAAMITAISEFTQSELIRHFSVPPEKIVVIPNPVDPVFQPGTIEERTIRVILQIGGSKNKNVDVLISAVKGLNVKLLLVRQQDTELSQRLNAAGIDFEFRMNLSKKELLAAYQDCDILYFASTYEGFGLPILEAMAVGRPVITSNISPMKEVAGEAALLVNPNNVSEVRNAISAVMQSPELRDKLIKKGMQNVKRYQGEAIAEQYFMLYQDIVSKHAKG